MVMMNPTDIKKRQQEYEEDRAQLRRVTFRTFVECVCVLSSVRATCGVVPATHPTAIKHFGSHQLTGTVKFLYIHQHPMQK